MKDLIPRYYPESIIANKGFYQNEKKAEKAAWDIGVGGTRPHSAFLDPVRPQVGLWATTVIKWDSYADEKLIVKDLKDFGIESIMRVEKDSLRFLTLEEYAKEAVTYDRFPKEKFYNYSFPEEVARIR